MKCTFAINSTAPAIVVIQDDQSQYTINKTLQRLQQDSDKGSVNITGLPAGEYSVRVYDNNIISHPTDTAAAAYEHSQLLHIIAFTAGPSLSTHIHSVYTLGPIVAFTGPSLLNAISTLHIHSIYTPGTEELYNLNACHNIFIS